MKTVPVLLIAAVVAASTACFGQGGSEIPVESAEIAVEVAPDGVELPAELEEQFDRLFDPNEVFLTGRLRRGLASAHLEVRRRAALALNAIGDNTGVPVMIEDMSAADAGDRALVVIALRKMKDRRAIDALIKAADDKVSHIRCIAIEALGEMHAEEAYDVIAKHLTDKDAVKGADVRMLPAESSCYALGELGERKAVPLLIKALGDVELMDEAGTALEKIKLGRGPFIERGRERFVGLGRQGESFGMDARKWTDWRHWENLDGTAVMVRLYPDWKTDPAAYEIVPVKVKSHSISLDGLEADEGSAVAVVADDQADELVRRSVKNRLYGWPFSKGLSMRLERYDSKPPAETRWFFDDALGNLIENATVEVYLRKYKGPRIKLGEIVTDGSFSKPTPQATLRDFEFVIRHSDYGIAIAQAPRGNESHIRVALVNRKTAAAERAIWGAVVDPDGYPIEGATILCYNVRTLGEGLINSNNERSVAITDAGGDFCMYMPPSKQFKDHRGKLIPPKSKYSVRIEPPRKTGLLPFTGQIENGKETTVFLESAGLAHTFVFMDEQGQITDVERLGRIGLTIDRAQKGRLTLGYNDWSTRQLFPTGTYTAEMAPGGRTGVDDERCKFEAVEVALDSPEQLVFYVPDSVIYTGRVVHGITGDPFAGAYVITMESICSKRLADITPEEWTAIHELGDEISANDPAVGPIAKAYGLGVIARTNAEGYYSIATRPGEDFYTFLTFEENYIPVSKRMYAQKPGDPRDVDVETLKLFPAAKILLEACVEEKHVSINPKWIINKGASPAWVGNLLKIEDRRTSFVRYNGWIEQNEPQHVFVPAEATFRLQLRMPYDEQWSPFTTEESFKLAHGEVLNIGKVRLQPALKVYVKIVNADAETVEGVPVRKLVDNHGSVAHNTDENGRVMFYLPPHSRGKFCVAHYGSTTADGRRLKEEMPYQVMGREDNNSEFVFQLSNEILYYMFE